ncbi:MAG: hypothetical protein FWC61_04635 [Proteobacteria bacterium]|nr:hypothetical protein [Pseudomonadota bacterium]
MVGKLEKLYAMTPWLSANLFYSHGFPTKIGKIEGASAPQYFLRIATLSRRAYGIF